nr:hypothetical protein [Micromonospora sp. DSM 115978]
MSELDTSVAEHAATSSVERLAFDQNVIRQLETDNQTVHGAPRLLVVGATANENSPPVILICQWHGSGYFVDQTTGDPAQEIVEAWFPYQVWFIDGGDESLVVDHIYDGEHACDAAPA